MFGTLVVEKEEGEKYIENKGGEGLPIGLIASTAAPFLSETAKPLFKIFYLDDALSH